MVENPIKAFALNIKTKSDQKDFLLKPILNFEIELASPLEELSCEELSASSNFEIC